MNPSERIDQLIAGLTDWRGKTLASIRKSILEADREIIEEWKWMGSPVWSHDGMIAARSALDRGFAKHDVAVQLHHRYAVHFAVSHLQCHAVSSASGNSPAATNPGTAGPTNNGAHQKCNLYSGLGCAASASR